MDLTRWVHVKEPEKKLVKVLVDIPKIVLPDKTVFHPLNAGEVYFSTEIPSEVLRVLINRGAVKFV